MRTVGAVTCTVVIPVVSATRTVSLEGRKSRVRDPLPPFMRTKKSQIYGQDAALRGVGRNSATIRELSLRRESANINARSSGDRPSGRDSPPPETLATRRRTAVRCCGTSLTQKICRRQVTED